MRRYFEAPDGDGEPTVWAVTDCSGVPHEEPQAVIRRCDLAAPMRHLWGDVVRSLTAERKPVA